MSLLKPWNAEDFDPMRQIGKLFKYGKVKGSDIPKPILSIMGYTDASKDVDAFTVTSMTSPKVMTVVPL